MNNDKKADSQKHRGFTIEVYEFQESGYRNFYVSCKKLDGSLIHDLDLNKCTLHDTVSEALYEGKEIIDNFLDN